MKWRSLAATLAASTVIAFAGAVSGTLAWYAYATRASVSYEGTSVYNTEQLQIGLKLSYSLALDDRSYYSNESERGADYVSFKSASDAATFTEIVNYDEDSDGNYDYTYWFMEPGASLTSDIIDRYIELTGGDSKYNHTLVPVTTRDFNGHDNFHLYRSPTAGKYDLGDAQANTYKNIEFGFRVIRTDTGAHIASQDIWMVDTSFNTTGDVNEAVRLYMEGNRVKSISSTGVVTREDTTTLFNPNSQDEGETVVGGLLDLNRDGFYDYIGENAYSEIGKEILYGVDNVEGTHTFSDADYASKKAWEYNNINSYEPISKNTEMNTFYAAHKIGNTGFENYDGLTLPTSKYVGRNTIYPTDESGKLSGGKVLTSTSSDDMSIADLSMTIYLEGWDHSVIDSNIEHEFNLGLTFQINKVE